MKDVDADYYGYCDDDDGILIPFEQESGLDGKKLLVELTCEIVGNFISPVLSGRQSCCRVAG